MYRMTFITSIGLLLGLVAGATASPVLTTGDTVVSPGSIDRAGGLTTAISVDFTDVAQPAISVYIVSFQLRDPFGQITVVADQLGHGTGGLIITDNGGGSYSAAITWDPPGNILIGSYDLYAWVSDGVTPAIDDFANNSNELAITNGGENTPPVVAADATYISPPAVERIGPNSATMTAQFFDPDLPALSVFLTTFKLRLPNQSELILAQNAGDGQSGVSIIADGGGFYTASVSWDPTDSQDLGFYDLSFQVTESGLGSTDGFANNLDEFQIFDAISNNPPTIVGSTTTALPSTVNRTGADFTMLKASFSDQDIPGAGTFRITFKVLSPGALETTIVNNALDGEQGLRVVNVGGENYEASVLWDPSDSDEVGAYDLNFSVTDANNATAIDYFPANYQELTLVATTIEGDGYLLHRSNDGSNCGGPNSACHNINDHQGSSCVTCHSGHGTANIYLVRETIQTPNSGPRSVLFKTRGIGDPWNSPDPTPGDPTSGTMADASDGVYTNVCEVCHTSTGHHRNDASTPAGDHYDANDCTTCHAHDGGFSSGESAGGSNCAGCHGTIFSAMESGAAGYHHVITTADPDYVSTNKTCLMCHVDHDIFRPDLNPGFGDRGSNLRADSQNTPVAGDASVLTNTDFSPLGSGGLCLSCHGGNDCLACHGFKSGDVPPAGTNKAGFYHYWIDRTAFGASAMVHSYTVPSTFGADGSAFNANCVKCHNDNMAKQYQNSTVQTGLHATDYRSLLAPLSIAAPADPLEEEFCFSCHSTTSNPNSGSNQDYYGVRAMSTGGPMIIEDEFSKNSVHPVGGTTGVHTVGELPATMARHVECMDCHNPHEATADRPPSPALSGALYGVEGIDINGSLIDPVTSSYQVCLKCHGDQNSGSATVSRQIVNTNVREEFMPTSASFHPVAAVGKNSNVPSLINPLNESSIITCEDCHAAESGGARGPHGSQYSPILKMQYVTTDNTSESSAAYALCYSCHSRSSLLSDDSFGDHDKHIRGEQTPCSVCHDPHGIRSAPNGDGSNLINFDDAICSPDPNTGRYEFVDDGLFAGTCYVTCHGEEHDGYNY